MSALTYDARTAEERVAALGLEIPDYVNPPYGGRYGAMKAFHHTGKLLMLSGMTPEGRDGVMLNPGRIGDDVSSDEGYAAGRKTAISVLGLIRLALGSLDEVESMARTVCYGVTTPDYLDVNIAGNGANDLFLEVFGPVAGRVASASIGVMSLSRGNSFEIVATVETKRDASEYVNRA
ncbi:RidA family protein [Homoserinimonas hongtaonis]|uniref:RidA family protein n=1 Tax=Homoserinimonas hongtaonis TaxID=2079791 RepID=A0A2U1SWP1_9MICO|nr:RidA family protein [Salinibacterium hongtaonis]AWB88606.1 RidA family protein [Salinibacterium hongtaonis]PWB96016.1 RidA family protein [Salinibacterium hongtaonis]